MIMVIKPPSRWYPGPQPGFSRNVNDPPAPTIFLAGSIEMGVAENWQEELTRKLSAADLDCVLLNPRRDDWDSSWVQSIDNPQFRGQVEWELIGLEECDLVALCFDPSTKSPISLLELGWLLGRRRRLIVCCPDGFWRKGNVEIVCRRYGAPLVHTRQEFVEQIIQYIKCRNQGG